MSLLTIEQLQCEVELCEQILFGVWLPKYSTGLKGMVNENRSDEPFIEAVNVWKKRLQRARDELFERQVLI